MEKIVVLLIPVLFAVSLVRMLLMPMRMLWKLALHSGSGFLCLWLLNFVSGFTGIFFPVNLVTILTAGFLGLPGIALLAFLTVL